MATYKRKPEDDIEQLLIDSGWKFAGTALFTHPKINKFLTKEQALSVHNNELSDYAEIVIKVKGPHASDVVKDFWAWFLDGGGAQMFCDPDLNPNDGDYSFYDTYDKDNEEWIIRVEDKNEHST